jgi:hypothetical protein
MTAIIQTTYITVVLIVVAVAVTIVSVQYHVINAYLFTNIHATISKKIGGIFR